MHPSASIAEPNALSDFWDQHGEALYATAFEVAKSSLHGALFSEAEDVAVAALEDLFTGTWTSFELGVVRRRLACIAKRKSIDYLRHRTAEKRDIGKVSSMDDDQDGSPIQVAGDAPDPATEVLTRDDGRFLGELLSSLPERRRGILVDFYYCDLSYQELAAKYGYDINSIGGEISRAKKTLLDVLQSRTGLVEEIRQGLGMVKRALNMLLMCLP